MPQALSSGDTFYWSIFCVGGFPNAIALCLTYVLARMQADTEQQTETADVNTVVQLRRSGVKSLIDSLVGPDQSYNEITKINVKNQSS